MLQEQVNEASKKVLILEQAYPRLCQVACLQVLANVLQHKLKSQRFELRSLKRMSKAKQKSEMRLGWQC